jgi:arylsulfatase A-like enzyme
VNSRLEFEQFKHRFFKVQCAAENWSDGGFTEMARRRILIVAITSIAVGLTLVSPVISDAASPQPSVVVITVDALRADHLGSYGYSKSTSPNIDRLMSQGLRFERAWTPEPLTGPAMCSMVTGLEPHGHAATRNGLRMKSGLNSLPKILADNGWKTAAFVGTWTLKNNLTLLGEHFETYGERLERKRWFGILNSEATCEDVTDDALDWLGEERKKGPEKPFFLWVHYIEPHAPYRFHQDYADRIGVNDDQLTKIDRYDTEIAAVDESIARLLAGVRQAVDDKDLLVVLTADHGESLGEHNYWGHGRYLYEPSLRIPLGISWNGVIPAGTVSSQATLLDLMPTLLELVGVDFPEDLPGRSWAKTARGADELDERVGCYQAHRGAVHGESSRESDKKRSKGLLWVGVIEGDRKEMTKVSRQLIQIYDLAADPGELETLAPVDAEPSDALAVCLARVAEGLGSLDELATQILDDETVEKLKALGYLE